MIEFSTYFQPIFNMCVMWLCEKTIISNKYICLINHYEHNIVYVIMCLFIIHTHIHTLAFLSHHKIACTPMFFSPQNHTNSAPGHLPTCAFNLLILSMTPSASCQLLLPEASSHAGCVIAQSKWIT